MEGRKVKIFIFILIGLISVLLLFKFVLFRNGSGNRKYNKRVTDAKRQKDDSICDAKDQNRYKQQQSISPSIRQQMRALNLAKITAAAMKGKSPVNLSDAFPINVRLKKGKKEKYSALEILGKGGFGEVYLSSSHKNKKKENAKNVAIKLSLYKRGFQREWKALEKLGKYPYFPKIHFKGKKKVSLSTALSPSTSSSNKIQSERVYYIGMENIRGFDVDDYCEFNGGPLGQHQLKVIAGQLLVAIKLMHKKKKLFHRDIKPRNIMIDEKTLRIKLIDFGGTVKALTDRTTITSWYGSPAFMASEVYECYQRDTSTCKYTRLADWYSAGITLYYLATLKFMDRSCTSSMGSRDEGRCAISTGNHNLDNLIERLTSDRPKKRKFNFKRHPYFKGLNWKRISY